MNRSTPKHTDSKVNIDLHPSQSELCMEEGGGQTQDSSPEETGEEFDQEAALLELREISTHLCATNNLVGCMSMTHDLDVLNAMPRKEWPDFILNNLGRITLRPPRPDEWFVTPEGDNAVVETWAYYPEEAKDEDIRFIRQDVVDVLGDDHPYTICRYKVLACLSSTGEIFLWAKHHESEGADPSIWHSAQDLAQRAADTAWTNIAFGTSYLNLNIDEEASSYPQLDEDFDCLNALVTFLLGNPEMLITSVDQIEEIHRIAVS